MFIVFGIIAILAGVFVFQQGSAISTLLSFAGANASVGGSFTIVAICLIVSGALLIASKNGEKVKFIKGSGWCHGIAFVAAVINYGVGDLVLWTWVNLAICIAIFVWLRRRRIA